MVGYTATGAKWWDGCNDMVSLVEAMGKSIGAQENKTLRDKQQEFDKATLRATNSTVKLVYVCSLTT